MKKTLKKTLISCTQCGHFWKSPIFEDCPQCGSIETQPEEGIQVITKPVKPAFTWPGGYQITYISDQGNLLCSKCATDNQEDEKLNAFIHYEGPSLFCHECNHEMTSSYGDIDE